MSDIPFNPSEATKRLNPSLFVQPDYQVVQHVWGGAKAVKVRMEEDIHDDIERLCRSRGWYIVHSRMDRKTTVQVGTPDFIIALPGGKTLWIECKRPGGKLTEKQHGALRWLRKLGHEAEGVSEKGKS